MKLSRAQRAYYKKHYEKNKRAGLCTQCGTKAVRGQVRCAACRDRKRGYMKKYTPANTRRLRVAALQQYGSVCACCGESHFEFLQIDHINGGGKKHVESIGGNLTAWLKRNKYPAGFQVLCANCNWSIGVHGFCPHTGKSLGQGPKLPEIPIEERNDNVSHS